MWSAGVRFFWRFLLGLCGNGITQSLQRGVQLGSVVLCGHHIYIFPLTALLPGKEVEDTQLLGEFLKFPHILLFDPHHLGRRWVPGKPPGTGFTHHLVVLFGEGQQQSRYIFQPCSCQLDGAFGCLDTFFYHQISGFSAHIHVVHLPFSNLL